MNLIFFDIPEYCYVHYRVFPPRTKVYDLISLFGFPLCFSLFPFPDENGLLEYEPHRRGRIYLRRLSGSGVSAAAAEVFLRNQVCSLTFRLYCFAN